MMLIIDNDAIQVFTLGEPPKTRAHTMNIAYNHPSRPPSLCSNSSPLELLQLRIGLRLVQLVKRR